MNGVRVAGIDDVVRKLQGLPESIDQKEAFREVAEIFAARLRAATPAGYSGRLKDSVIYEAEEDGAEVGYEREVETAGNPELDSVIRPKTRGRSVLKWVSTDELSAVLEETFDAYSPEGVLFMEEKLLEQIHGGS